MTDTPPLVLKKAKPKKPPITAKAPSGLEELLAEQGFRLTQDESGFPSIQFEGNTYYLLNDEDDAEFYQVLYPNFWPLESEEESIRALLTCDAVNREGRLVKLHLAEDDVWVSVEAMHETPAAFMHFLPQYLGFIQVAVGAFRDLMLSDEFA